MKALQKLMAIGIGLIGFSFQANSYETDAYAKVVSSEPVWSVKTISQPNFISRRDEGDGDFQRRSRSHQRAKSGKDVVARHIIDSQTLHH